MLALITKREPIMARKPTLSERNAAPTIRLVTGSIELMIAALEPPMMNVPRWKSIIAPPLTTKPNTTQRIQGTGDFGRLS